MARRLQVGAALSATLLGGAGGTQPVAASLAPSGSAMIGTRRGGGPSGTRNGTNACATPAGAVTYWVNPGARGRLQTGVPGQRRRGGTGAGRNRCVGACSFTKVATALHNAWDSAGIALPPQGTVRVVTPAQRHGDGTATIPDTASTVDGRTSHALELIGASGDTSSVSMSFVLKEVNQKWAVSDGKMDL